jgi:hypothetical protein
MSRTQAIAAIAILFAFSAECLSAIISRDFHSLNDGLLIYDTQTGREWLAMSQTNSLTVEQIESQIESGPLSGFAIASLNDVTDLARSASLDASVITLDFPTALNFIDTINGQPQSSPNYRFAKGAVADELYFANYTLISLTAVLDEIPGALNRPVGPGHYAYWSTASYAFYNLQARIPSGGFWLFRNTAIPEPPPLPIVLTAVMFCSGKRRGKLWRI